MRISAAEPRSISLGREAREPTKEAAVGLLSETDDRPSLAVLPFANMSGEVEQDYFADGITDDLTTELSKLSRLLVISRHSAFVYKGVAKKAQEIAKELGVRYLLEGSVRRAGERVRIVTQLTDSTSGAHVWAERYDRDLRDIFAVQDDVTRRIVDTLQVKLSASESEDLGHEGTASIEAHDMLLRGVERHWLYAKDSIAEAQVFFRKAVELDPEYAVAHAWLARSYAFQWTMNWTPDELLERAYEHAKIAVRLDARLPLSHAMLGWVQMWRKQAEEAIGAGRRAVALDPNNADAQLFFSVTLTAAGRGKESLSYIRNAMRLNPHPSVIYLWGLGMSYMVLGQYEEAIVAFKRGIELRDVFIPNHAFLATAYAALGREQEMAAARDKALALAGGRKPPVAQFWLDQKLRDRQAAYWKLAGLL
jgi:TolB-like protein/Tfp pilus assembly protein PilF